MSALETTYQELIYATKAGMPIGAGSRFAYAILSRSDDAERRNMTATFRLNPIGGGVDHFVLSTAADPFLQSVIGIANEVPVGGDIGVTKRSADFRASGGAFRVNVRYPWLESSYETGFVARSDTEVAITRISPVQHALSFEEAIGIDSSLTPVTLTSELVQQYEKQVTLEGKPPSSFMPDKITIAISGVPFASVSFVGQLGEDLPSEVERTTWATLVATRIAAMLATLRVFRAAYLAANVAIMVDKQFYIDAEKLFETTRAEIATRVSLAPGMVNVTINEDDVGGRQFVNNAVGVNIVEAIQRNAEARLNVLVPLKRISDGRFRERDSVTRREIVYKAVRDTTVKHLFGEDAKVDNDDDLIRSVRAMQRGSNFNNLALAIDYMQRNVDGETMPFLVTLYREVLVALGSSLESAGLSISRQIQDSLRTCASDVFEAKPLVALMARIATEKTSVQNLALVSLIVEDSAQPAELRGHLERVRDCLRLDKNPNNVNLDDISALIGIVKNDTYFRPVIGGEYVPGTLRDRVLAAIPEMAKTLEETFLAATGIALVLSQNVRRPISLMKKFGGIDENDNEFAAFDAEINDDTAELRRLALGARQRDWSSLTTLTPSEVASVVMRLEELDAKIRLGSFKTFLGRASAPMALDDFKDRYGAILSHVRAARVAAVALRSLYTTGITPNIQELQDSITEGNVELDRLDRETEKLLIRDVSARLLSYLDEAQKSAPPRIRGSLKELSETMRKVPLTLSSAAYGKRILEAVHLIRGNAQELVDTYASSPSQEGEPFQTFLDAQATLTAAGHLAIFERELMIFLGADEAQINTRVELSLVLTERRLASKVALNLSSRVATTTPGLGAGGDEDYNRERIAYVELLKKIATEGTSSYVPIPSQIQFRAIPKSPEDVLLVDDEYSALAAAIDRYKIFQDAYFSQLFNRPIPDFGMTILTQVLLDPATRDSMQDTIVRLIGDFGGHRSQRFVVEHDNIDKALRNDAFERLKTDDRSRFAALRNVVTATNRYFVAIDAFPSIQYDPQLELEYETVIRIQRTVVSLLRESNVPVPQLQTPVPPRFAVQDRPLPGDLLDLLNSASPLFAGVKSGTVGMLVGNAFDDFVVQLSQAETTAQLQQLVADNLEDLQNVQGAVESARAQAIISLVEAGMNLVAKGKEIATVFADARRAESKRERALALEGMRFDLALLLATIRDIAAIQQFENWPTVRKWIDIGNALDREVVTSLATLPETDRTIVEAATLKTRTAFLNDMKKVVASISADLGKQLRKISDLAAGGAEKADKTEEELVKKLNDINALLGALNDQQNGIEALKVGVANKTAEMRALSPTVVVLDGLMKEANRELTRARKTLTEIVFFNSVNNVEAVTNLAQQIDGAVRTTRTILELVKTMPTKAQVDDARKTFVSVSASYEELAKSTTDFQAKWGVDIIDRVNKVTESYRLLKAAIDAAPSPTDVSRAIQTSDRVRKAHASVLQATTKLDVEQAMKKLAAARQQLVTANEELSPGIAAYEAEVAKVNALLVLKNQQLSQINSTASDILSRTNAMQAEIAVTRATALEDVQVAAERLAAAIEVSSIADESSRVIALARWEEIIKSQAKARALQRQLDSRGARPPLPAVDLGPPVGAVPSLPVPGPSLPNPPPKRPRGGDVTDDNDNPVE